MQLIKDIWTKDDYQEYVKYLTSIKDEKNKLFSEKLIFTKYEILGIKIPIQKDIAKQIVKGNYQEFLKNTKFKYQEEVMIYGFVIAYSKDIKIVDKYLDKYISLIDNWSLCDSFSSSLKILKKYDYFNKAKDLSLSNKEYQIRVGLTIILFQYINENNLKEIFNILDNLKLDTYYVNMAASWLLCDLFIKYRNDTLEYIKHTKVNDFIFNKFISKCRDSFRVSKKDKDFLKTLKK